MSDRLYTHCHEAGCSTRTQGTYCDRHKTDNQAARNRTARDHDRKTSDPVWKLYNCAAWVRFRTSVLSNNPICQHIIDGKACSAPATIVHHIVSPRKNGRLMYTFSNVRAVCPACHPNTKAAHRKFVSSRAAVCSDEKSDD